MKILCIREYEVNARVIPELVSLEKLGCEVFYLDNPYIDSIDKEMECMHETELHGPEGYPYPPELCELIKDVDIVVVHVTPLPRIVLEKAEKLKMVAIMRGGCDNVDVEYLLDKGITVTNAPWRSANAVADATIGMILAETKNIARSHYAIKEGKWPAEFPNSENIHNLATRTIGIIGFGHIGQRVAKRLSGFETKIIVHDPYIPAETIEKYGYDFVSKETLLKDADIITIHLRQSELTEGFIGSFELNMMKPTATIINTSRARLIDEKALIKALENYNIQGAALDVFYDEPLDKEHPLIKLENVTLTPHIAGASEDTMYDSFTIVFEDIKRYLSGKSPVYLVKPIGRK